jgi:hypothetical protein
VIERALRLTTAYLNALFGIPSSTRGTEAESELGSWSSDRQDGRRVWHFD